MRVLMLLCLLALGGCVNPIPGGEGDGSKPPKMTVIDSNSLIAVHEFPGYCNYGLERPYWLAPVYQGKIGCHGEVRITDNGSHLILYGAEDEPQEFQYFDLDSGLVEVHKLATPIPDNQGRFIRGIGYPFLVLSDVRGIDRRSGRVFELEQPYVQFPNNNQMILQPGATDEQREYIGRRPAGRGYNPSLSPFGHIISDPAGSERLIYIASFNGRPSIDWNGTTVQRFFVDDGKPAPIPGPNNEDLADVISLEHKGVGGDVLEDGWRVQRSYGKGWTNLVAQSTDGLYAIWGWSDDGESVSGYGVFQLGSSEPIWVNDIERGKPRHVGFTDSESPQVFESQNYRIGTQTAYLLKNIRSGEVEGELSRTKLFLRKVAPKPKPSQELRRVGVQCLSTGGTGCAENEKYFVGYGLDSTGHTELIVADKETLEIVFRQSLERDFRRFDISRSVSVDIAKKANRVAVLSTDGKVRVFEF